MTDVELLSNYLNRYYNVIIGSERQGSLTETSLMVGEFGTDNVYSKVNLLSEIMAIFKGVPDITTTFELWFYKSLRKLELEFDTFLAECELVLGPTNWVVKHKRYGETHPSLFSKYVSPEKSNLRTLAYLFDKWYDDKVIEASEKAWVNSYR